MSISSQETAIKNCGHVTNYPAIFLRLLSNCYTMKMDWAKTADILDQIITKSVEQAKKEKSRYLRNTPNLVKIIFFKKSMGL